MIRTCFSTKVLAVVSAVAAQVAALNAESKLNLQTLNQTLSYEKYALNRGKEIAQN